MENRFENTPEEGRAAWRPHYEVPPGTDPPKVRPFADAQGQTGLCARVQDMLPSLLENDGDLRPEMASAVYGHLSACAICAREFEEMQRVVSLLEALPPAEMPVDFSGLIMQRIALDSPPLRTFAAPTASSEAQAVVSVERKTEEATLRGTSQTASILGNAATTHTTGQYALSESQQEKSHQQTILAGVFTALMVFFLTTSWGRQMLGVNVASAAAWVEQLGETLRQLPILGFVVRFVFSALAQVAETVSEAYRTLGATAARGLALDAALCAGGYYYLTSRRQRGQMRGA